MVKLRILQSITLILVEEEDEEEIQVANVSLAYAKEVSIDAAVVVAYIYCRPLHQWEAVATSYQCHN